MRYLINSTTDHSSKKKKKDQKVKSRDKGCFQSENPDESSDRKEEFEKEQEELQELATQKKNEDIWSGRTLHFYHPF